MAYKNFNVNGILNIFVYLFSIWKKYVLSVFVFNYFYESFQLIFFINTLIGRIMHIISFASKLLMIKINFQRNWKL